MKKGTESGASRKTDAKPILAWESELIEKIGQFMHGSSLMLKAFLRLFMPRAFMFQRLDDESVLPSLGIESSFLSIKPFLEVGGGFVM